METKKKHNIKPYEYLTDEEILEVGLPLTKSDGDPMHILKNLKRKGNFMIFSDPRYNFFYFYHPWKQNCYRVSYLKSGVFRYRKVKRNPYDAWENLSRLNGREFKFFFYFFYAMPTMSLKENGMPCKGEKEVNRKLHWFVDVRIENDMLHAGLNEVQKMTNRLKKEHREKFGIVPKRKKSELKRKEWRPKDEQL